jgi:hypothetical protein
VQNTRQHSRGPRPEPATRAPPRTRPWLTDTQPCTRGECLLLNKNKMHPPGTAVHRRAASRAAAAVQPWLLQIAAAVP